MTNKYCLCQDCLAILPYSDALHGEEEFCMCGGVMCGCDGCNHDIEQGYCIAQDGKRYKLEVPNAYAQKVK